MKLQFFVLLQIIAFTAFCSAHHPWREEEEKKAREAEEKRQADLRYDREHYPEVFTTTGVRCVIPFKVDGELYFGCTSTNVLPTKKWCRTVYEVAPGQDRSKVWGYCQTSNNLTAVTYTYSGERCFFPFLYKKVRYYGCTTIGHPRHKSWCVIMDQNTHGPSRTGKTDLCRDSRNAEIDTYGGTGRGAPCRFPFRVGKQIYWGCSNDHDGWGQYRCTTKYGWGYCNVIDTETNLKRLRNDIGSIYKESTCVFPFIYNEQQQFGCIGSSPWCSTTADYDTDGEYKWCDGTDILSVASRKKTAGEQFSCTFPYLKNGTLWSEFILNPKGGTGFHKDEYVCPRNYNLENDERLVPGFKSWNQGYYDEEDLIPSKMGWGVTYKCPRPWYYQNIMYHGCAIGKSFSRWCSKKIMFDNSYDWNNCYKLDKISF